MRWVGDEVDGDEVGGDSVMVMLYSHLKLAALKSFHARSQKDIIHTLKPSFPKRLSSR
jgi:hypothetical protein